MTDFVKSTNFASKDSLSIGNPLKIVKGTEIDTEFNNIATAVATKADIANPTFTGVPAAPTAASGTNTTQLATTAFVTDAVASGKVSPALTGVPTAPTAAVNTNTTQVATTAFVTAQIADDAPTKTGTGASGTWAIEAATVTTITTSQVLTATASASVGSVGSYALMSCTDNVALSPGTTKAGSLLLYRATQAGGGRFGSGNYVATAGTSGASGTWRLMGNINGEFEYGGVNINHSNTVSLWLRIS